MSDIKYGVIEEDGISFISPRGIDEGPFGTLEGAFREAVVMIKNGVARVSIVRCRYSTAQRAEFVEIPGGCIKIDARDAELLDEEGK